MEMLAAGSGCGDGCCFGDCSLGESGSGDTAGPMRLMEDTAGPTRLMEDLKFRSVGDVCPECISKSPVDGAGEPTSSSSSLACALSAPQRIPTSARSCRSSSRSTFTGALASAPGASRPASAGPGKAWVMSAAQSSRPVCSSGAMAAACRWSPAACTSGSQTSECAREFSGVRPRERGEGVRGGDPERDRGGDPRGLPSPATFRARPAVLGEGMGRLLAAGPGGAATAFARAFAEEAGRSSRLPPLGEASPGAVGSPRALLGGHLRRGPRDAVCGLALLRGCDSLSAAAHAWRT
mmetsp:Transcript_68627/g.221740  ORF Transcript_68627/g.221740 Transcript_68627/m.221740 type:complete len:294 (-) Transcript_68627:309-1190(-)